MRPIAYTIARALVVITLVIIGSLTVLLVILGNFSFAPVTDIEHELAAIVFSN